MTKTYKYPDFVDRENIEIIEGPIKNFPYRWRTALIIPFKSDGDKEKKTVTFIMKNPSIADKLVCDKTISNVLYYVNQIKNVDARFLDIKEVKILNLFSIYSTDSTALFDILNKIGDIEELKKNNNKAIKKLLNDTDFIVPAWGKKPDNVTRRANAYRDRAIEVMNIVRNNDTDHQIFLIKYKKKRTLYPIHPERIGYKGMKINKFSLYRYEIQGNWFVPSNL